MSRSAAAVVLTMLLTTMSVSATNRLVSVGSSGISQNAVIAADGRYVVFQSLGQLVAEDTNATNDIYRRDMVTGTTVLVSVNGAGTAAGNGSSTNHAVSADGRYVAFESLASNLVANDTNGQPDVFLRDIVGGTTTLISRRDPAQPPGSSSAAGASGLPTISADGRYIAFQSDAASTDLLPPGADTNGFGDVYDYDSTTGTMRLISKASPSLLGNGASSGPFMSGNGLSVVFQTNATNFATDTNGFPDVFVWDRPVDTLRLVSHSAASPSTTANSQSLPGIVTTLRRVISDDGSKIVFQSFATNLVAGQSDANGFSDVFLYDMATGTNTLVSHVSGSSTTTGNGTASDASISSDGNFVAYLTTATNVVAGQNDVNGAADVFLFQRATGLITLLSGVNGSATSTGNGLSTEVAVNANGSAIAFASTATNLVPGQNDTNGTRDVFLRRVTGTPVLISMSTAGTNIAGNGLSDDPDISLSGLSVAYESLASDLVAGDTNGQMDVFINSSNPAINVVKLTNGTDNNSAPGQFVPVGSVVTFTYIVTNPGDVALSTVTGVDDNGTPGTPADDFTPTYTGGDTNGNGLLDTTETWTFTAARIATAGQYTNTVTFSGLDAGLGITVSDTDADNHFGSLPGINLVKLTNGTDNDTPPGVMVPAGSLVTFTYIVTNTGNVPLAAVNVGDDNGTPGNVADDFNPAFVTGDTNANGLLDLTETWTYTANRIANPGQYTNTGTATGTPPPGAGAPVSDTNPDNYFGSSPGINVVKLTNGTDNNTPTGPVVPVGSTVTFTYIVANTGNVPLSAVVVRDDNGTPGNTADDFNAFFVAGDTNGNGLLDLTETWTFTATRIATAGQYTNSATATGTPAVGPPVSDTDTDNHFGASPAINVVKLTNGTNNDTPPGIFVPTGSTVTFTYVVTNTGNVPLSGVVVRDDNGTPGNPADDFNATFVGGDTSANGLLDPTETWTFTASRIATAGQYTNIATATGTPPLGAGAPVSDTNPDSSFGSSPAINMVKFVNGTDSNTPPGLVVATGNTVTFTYVVTNTGNVPLSGVVVRDDNGTPGNPADDFNAPFTSGDTNGNGLLDTTETFIFTETRTAIAGQYTNLATATGTPPPGAGAPVSDTDPANYFGTSPAINLVKLTNGTDNNAAPGAFVPVGSTVTFTYVVTNTGNVPLTGVVVVDDNGTPGIPADNFNATFVGGDTNGNGQLDLTETWTFTSARIATAGQYTNIATASGTGSGTPVSDSDSDNHFGGAPAINVVKLTNGTDNNAAPGVFVVVGSTVTFTYVVTNTGNVPLSGVVVVDDNGTPGNVADDFSATFAGGDTNANGLLDLTETWTFTTSRIATSGQYTNTGTVTGTPPAGAGAPVSDSDSDNHFGTAPAINLVKLTNGTDNNTAPGVFVPVGSTVTFTYVVTNTGDVSLSGVIVTDDNGTSGNNGDDFNATFVGGDANGNGLLDLTETWTFTSTRIATAGQYTNVGTATGTPILGGGQVSDADSDNHFGSAPGTNVVKLTNGTDNNAAPGIFVPIGSTVTFTYVVTNTGNVPLSGVVVVDDNGTPGSAADDFNATFVGGDTNTNGLLDLTETWTFTASTIAASGQYTNIATASGTGSGTPVSDSDPDSHFGISAGINVVKLTNGTDNNAAPGVYVPVGTTVTFTYVVTNPGNVPLSGVTVSDDNGTPGNAGDDFNAAFIGGDTNANGFLDTTETWTFSATRIATAGQYTNTATATGTPSTGGAPVSDSDTDNHFGSDPAINLVELTNGTDNNTAPGPFVTVGSTVTFTFNVTNPGNVPLSGVVVSDDNGTPADPSDDPTATFTGGDTNANGLLDPGETWTFTATGVATAGAHVINGSATGTPPVGPAVSDSDVEHYFGGPAVASTPTLQDSMLLLMAAMLAMIALMKLKMV